MRSAAVVGAERLFLRLFSRRDAECSRWALAQAKARARMPGRTPICRRRACRAEVTLQLSTDFVGPIDHTGEIFANVQDDGWLW